MQLDIDGLGITVYEGYGLTETSPIVCANRPGAKRLGSVGKPIPNVDVYIAGDHLKTSGGYSASQAHLHDSADEVVTGVRYKW